MKKNVFLVLAGLIIMVSACKLEPVPIPSNVVSTASITILSPIAGETYRAGQRIFIRWKTSNVPVGSAIHAVITSSGSGAVTGADLVPRDLIPTLPEKITSNDGEEWFTLPDGNSNLYHSTQLKYGKTFNIRLEVIYPKDDGTVATRPYAESGLFTVSPPGLQTGCTIVTPSFSTVTGEPCTPLVVTISNYGVSSQEKQLSRTNITQDIPVVKFTLTSNIAGSYIHQLPVTFTISSGLRVITVRLKTADGKQIASENLTVRDGTRGIMFEFPDQEIPFDGNKNQLELIVTIDTEPLQVPVGNVSVYVTPYDALTRASIPYGTATSDGNATTTKFVPY
jgi:hypothetical protein